MTKKLAYLAALALVTVGTLGCWSTSDNPAAVAGATTPVEIMRQVQGDDPGLTAIGVTLVNSAEDLAALGATHPDLKAIDYTSCTVVLVTLGQRPTGGFAVKIEAAQELGDDLFIQVEATHPSPDAKVSPKPTHPFAAAVLAKRTATHVISEPGPMKAGAPMPMPPATAPAPTSINN